jgi:putative ABC transport system substrate-binding protein
MKKGRILIVVVLVLLAFIVVKMKPRIGGNAKDVFRVQIVSQVEIDPIVQLRKGFRDEFTNSPFAHTKEVIFSEFNAQGDQALVNQIADRIAVDKPNLVYVLGTSAAQTIQKRAPEILLVQGAVTDPVAAGLAASWKGSGRKYVATSDLPPIGVQLQLIQQLTPKIKRLGVIYNPGESNSVAVISRLRDEVHTGLQLVEKPISNSADVSTVLAALQGRIDGIYIPPDNTAHSALPVISKFCHDNRLPLYASVRSAIDSGALATLSLDFVELGKESADLALQVLKGSDPGSIPIQVNRNPTVSISGSTAIFLGVDLAGFEGKPNVVIIK